MVFTGALRLSRHDAAVRSARPGMAVAAGVTQPTTHLVVGDQDLMVLTGHATNSKHRRADHLVQIISEAEVMKFVTSGGSR